MSGGPLARLLLGRDELPFVIAEDAERVYADASILLRGDAKGLLGGGFDTLDLVSGGGGGAGGRAEFC